MNQDVQDCDIINRLFIWRRKDEKLSLSSNKNDEGMEFIKIPMVNNKRIDENIVALLIRSNNKLSGNPVVIIAHGNGETIDYYKQFANEFLPQGISVCIPDYRGYGYSDGEYGTASVNEREDIIAVYQYLKNQGFEKISYFGRSLGATCGIFLAAECPDLVCIALDSPWMSTIEWNQHMAQEFYHIDADRYNELLPIVLSEIECDTEINFNEVEEPREAASKITQPLFLMHGKYDDIIPPENSDEFYGLIQSQEKYFEPFDGNHNDGRRTDIFYRMFKFILHYNGIEIPSDDS